MIPEGGEAGMSKKIVETHKSKTVRKESTTLGKVAKGTAIAVAIIVLLGAAGKK
jgi:hypothetical protein